ncbi:hypothetical protein [Indiicoccus explosivorum]|uniref:hypothetical protein n=1 Tax=Indiicoccus explosivorum TaxID=1917864 RepID=UPI000B444B26|nr:hypothetical protein [Indiicoccus explosivorum]
MEAITSYGVRLAACVNVLGDGGGQGDGCRARRQIDRFIRHKRNNRNRDHVPIEIAQSPDSYVLSRPYESRFDLFDMITALTFIQRTLAEEGILAGGGLTAGLCAQQGAFFCGPAIFRAAAMASEGPASARIVVDAALLDGRMLPPRTDELQEKLFRELWIDSARLTAEDADGAVFINYLDGMYGLPEVGSRLERLLSGRAPGQARDWTLAYIRSCSWYEEKASAAGAG